MTGPLAKIAAVWTLAAGRDRAKAPLQQMAEMTALYLARGIGPGFYQLAGFWRRGVPFRDMLRYMNAREYARAVDELNHPAYQKLSQSKVVEKAILQLYGIPATRLLGVLAPTAAGQSVTGAPLRSLDDLEAFLRAIAPRRICFKANEGWGGSAFRAISVAVDDGVLTIRDLRDGNLVRLPEFYHSLGLTKDRIRVIEEMMEQHPALAALNPSSVNTMRLWVIDHGQGPRTRLAYLRIGRAQALVDNHTSGGILAPIDMATGRLGPATDGTAAHRIFARHPDSGTVIEGMVLPLFDEAQRLAERCLAVFPHINFAGIDVALAPDGPIIVEMNVMPDSVGSARVGIPTKDALAPF